MDNSRASSVEHEVNSLSLETSKKSFSDDEDSNFDELRPKRRGRAKVKPPLALNKASKKATLPLRLSKQNSFEDSAEIANTDSNSSTPPLSLEDVSRPVRAAVATAAAISEAQSQDMKAAKSKAAAAAGRKKRNAAIASRISGLDLLHDTTMFNIEESNKDVSAPSGCVNERLNKDHPEKLVHEELTTSLVTGEDGKPIPFQLQVLLDKTKKQYLSFIRHIQDPLFKEKIKAEIEEEKKKKEDFVKREKQLRSQIDNLVNDSLNLLKTRLNELGIQAKTPPEFIEKAKGIVCQHHDLQRNKTSLESEIRQLEIEQEKIIAAKGKFIFWSFLCLFLTTIF